MLRATSEIAVAIKVSSLEENFSDFASSRAFWRATSTSASTRIGTMTSPFMCANSGDLQERETLFKVEGGIDPFQRQAELHHREGDLGLDAHDDRGRAQQLDHLRDAAQRARGKGIHDVEQG